MSAPTLEELNTYKASIGESFACDCFYLKQLIEYSAYTLSLSEVNSLEVDLQNHRIKFSERDLQSYLNPIDDLINVALGNPKLRTIKECAEIVRNVLTKQALRSNFKKFV